MCLGKSAETDPAIAARGNRQAARADFQAGDRLAFTANEIVSHSGAGYTVRQCEQSLGDPEKLQPRTEVVGIDEAQFWGMRSWKCARSWRPWEARDRGGVWIRTIAAAPLNPCRGCWRLAEEITKAAGHLRALREFRRYTRSGWWIAKN